LLKTVWPSQLAVFYPYNTAPSASRVMIVAILLMAITGLAWWRRGNQPWLLTGWLWYLGVLVPVIGLIQVGGQGYADRYTYLPLIGIFIAVVWSVADLVAPRSELKRPLVVATVVVLIACAIVTWIQIGVWSDGETLLKHDLPITHGKSVAGDVRPRGGSAARALAGAGHRARQRADRERTGEVAISVAAPTLQGLALSFRPARA
jgi:hypothetical protein